MSGSTCAGMPIPVSLTVTCAWPSARSSASVTQPPSGVNLMAFESRFSNTWLRRAGSPRTGADVASSRTSRVIPLAAAAARATSARAPRIAARSATSSCRLTLPAAMRETSSRSSTRRTCALAADSMLATAFGTRSSLTSPRRSMPVQVSTALSGERSSCERTARNRSRASVAASASARARSASMRAADSLAMTRSRSRSSCLRSVTSRQIARMPPQLPSGSWTRDGTVSSQRSPRTVRASNSRSGRGASVSAGAASRSRIARLAGWPERNSLTGRPRSASALSPRWWARAGGGGGPAPPAPNEGERGRGVEGEEDVGEEAAAPADCGEDDDGAGPEDHARHHDDPEDARNGRLGARDRDRPAGDGRLHGEDQNGKKRREERLQAENDVPADRHAEPDRCEQRQAARHVVAAHVRDEGGRAVEILGAGQVCFLPREGASVYREYGRAWEGGSAGSQVRACRLERSSRTATVCRVDIERAGAAVTTTPSLGISTQRVHGGDWHAPCDLLRNSILKRRQP